MLSVLASATPWMISGCVGSLGGAVSQAMGPLVLGSVVEGLLLKVLVHVMIIVGFARLCANLFKRIGQPAAVGEIAAGLMLGPSLLGWVWPDVFQAVFADPEVAHISTILSQLGLVFLLFIIGLEFDFSHLRVSGAAAGLISISGIALPFALGWALAHYMHPRVAGQIPFTGFALFMGTSMSITAIPILGRIMMELNITRTRLGAITITASAIDDAVGWILLAACTAIVQSEFALWLAVKMFVLTVGFGVLLIVVLKPWLHRWATWVLKRNGGQLGYNGMAMLLVMLFLCAVATSKIGIFAIFGAFLFGAVFSNHDAFRKVVSEKLGDFVMVFFLPIFFTYTGLHTDITGLGSAQLWGMCVLVCAAAIAGKFGGCTLAAKLGGMNWRDSTVVGVMMNTRALMELIVLNVGLSLGVIPQSVFSMLVIMAMVTTAMCTPLLLLLMRRDPQMRPLLAQSDFRDWIGAERPRK
jgi:Kef-type K+ transport system membrane component KefB